MGGLVWICVFLLFHRADSYVLLTANVEDVHAVANQLINSPILQHLKDIWFKAKESFHENYKSDHGKQNTYVNRNSEGQESSEEQQLRAERRHAVNQIMEFGRNASIYLSSVKDIFDKL